MNLSEETIKHMGIEQDAWDAASDVERTRAIEVYVVRCLAVSIVAVVDELTDIIENLSECVPNSQAAYKIANGEVPFESIHDYIRDHGGYDCLKDEGSINTIETCARNIAEAQEMIQSMTYKWGDEDTLTYDFPHREAMKVLSRLDDGDFLADYTHEYYELFRWLKEHGDDGDEYPGYDE